MGGGVADATPVERMLSGGGRDGPTLETSEVSAERRFAEVRRLGTDDQDAVFEHFGVESPDDVMAAAEDPPAAARSRREPLVVGSEPFDPDAVLLADRTEGEAFNWVDADGGTGVADADDAGRSGGATADATSTGSGPGPVGRLLARFSALF